RRLAFERRRDFPIASGFDPARGIQREPVSGGQLFNSGECTPGIRNIAELEINSDGFGVHGHWNARRTETFQLAAEVEAFGNPGVIKRFLAEAIAREQQLAPPSIPDGVREHSAEFRNARNPFFFVEVNQRFGIAVGGEAMALCDELASQILIIVDLAIENDPHRTVFVRERLVSARKIDDAQAAHADGALSIDIDSFVIGTAMTDLSAHLPDDILPGRRAP